MLTNRQPTLHRPGLMAHRARVLKVCCSLDPCLLSMHAAPCHILPLIKVTLDMLIRCIVKGVS